jgi:hypothetical protein
MEKTKIVQKKFRPKWGIHEMDSCSSISFLAVGSLPVEANFRLSSRLEIFFSWVSSFS